jgi:hypothetical protein
MSFINALLTEPVPVAALLLFITSAFLYPLLLLVSWLLTQVFRWVDEAEFNNQNYLIELFGKFFGQTYVQPGQYNEGHWSSEHGRHKHDSFRWYPIWFIPLYSFVFGMYRLDSMAPVVLGVIILVLFLARYSRRMYKVLHKHINDSKLHKQKAGK